MNTVAEQAPAKLNLCLDVLGKRPDGYHDLRMLMQSVDLTDRVTVTPTEDGQWSCGSNFGFLPTDGRNLAVRAARSFFAAIQRPELGARIFLEKRIPVGAGMAGGSADAAAVLRALNRCFDRPLSPEALLRLAEGLGSDVPYCLLGGCRLAEGRGERLSPAPPLPDCAMVVCKPEFSIRTPELFARVDSRRSAARPDTDGMLDALARGDLSGVARRMFNVFEDVLPPRCGEVGTIKARLLSEGALGAVMTGTGSAVFGLFSDPEQAKTAAEVMRESWKECWAVRPTGASEL